MNIALIGGINRLADRHENDDRRDPDHDAEHGQERARFAVLQTVDRRIERIFDAHGC